MGGFLKYLLWLSGITLIILAAGGFLLRGWFLQQAFSPTETSVEQGVQRADSAPEEAISVIADELHVPWGIAFLPDGSFLVTERSGNVVRIENGAKTPIRIADIPATEVGEGGLLGIALHPDFPSNRFVYLYMTAPANGGLKNKVMRYELENNSLARSTIIIDNIPGARYHDGGRIAFGPDGMLYVTTGDASIPQTSQDTSSLAGKILRVADDGSIPADNPFQNAVYSYGHRNSQGITWDDAGQLWSTEHGRSGVLSGLDELNLIEPGQNYGWPEIEGDETQAGMRGPVIHSGADDTWAPGGAVFHNGSIFFTGLRGESMYEAAVEGSEVTSLRQHFRGEFGRLRTIELGPDGFFYALTSNTDGRGRERPGDDKVLRIDPELFAN